MFIKSLSVIIPAYNESGRIKPTLIHIMKYLKGKHLDFEIIVINDCSKDDTFDVVSSIRSDKIKIFNNKENKGKGYSVRKGMLLAKKEHVLFSDADLSTPIEELSKFDKHIQKNDIIIGSRNLPRSNILIKQPFIRSKLGKIFPLLVSLILLRGIKDTQCGFKLFRADIARKIFTKQTVERFGFDVEILYIAKKLGYKIKEIPITWKNAEGSTLDPVKDSIRMFKELMIIKYNSLIGRYR